MSKRYYPISPRGYAMAYADAYRWAMTKGPIKALWSAAPLPGSALWIELSSIRAGAIAR